jgi:hypothetical protein
MPRYRYNQRQQNSKMPLLEKVADDLPKGYAKAAMDLFNGVGPLGKIAVAAIAVIAAKNIADRFTK